MRADLAGGLLGRLARDVRVRQRAGLRVVAGHDAHVRLVRAFVLDFEVFVPGDEIFQFGKS